jgi:hypothetical protein
MKKNNFTLLIFLFLGLFAGLIGSMLIDSLDTLSILTKSIDLSWQPKADFHVIKYDIQLALKLDLMCLIGILGGYFLYRKL